MSKSKSRSKSLKKSRSKAKDKDADKEKKRLRPGDPYYYSPRINMEEEKIEMYREAFNCFDDDDAGVIKVEFLASILEIMGMEKSQTRVIIKDQKADGLATMTFEEFLNIMLRHEKEEHEFTEDVVRDAFKQFDPRNTGKIHRRALSEVLRTHCPEMEDEEIQNLVRDARPYKDGYIKYEDFIRKISLPAKLRSRSATVN